MYSGLRACVHLQQLWGIAGQKSKRQSLPDEEGKCRTDSVTPPSTTARLRDTTAALGLYLSHVLGSFSTMHPGNSGPTNERAHRVSRHARCMLNGQNPEPSAGAESLGSDRQLKVDPNKPWLRHGGVQIVADPHSARTDDAISG